MMTGRRGFQGPISRGTCACLLTGYYWGTAQDLMWSPPQARLSIWSPWGCSNDACWYHSPGGIRPPGWLAGALTCPASQREAQGKLVWNNQLETKPKSSCNIEIKSPQTINRSQRRPLGFFFDLCFVFSGVGFNSSSWEFKNPFEKCHYH